MISVLISTDTRTHINRKKIREAVIAKLATEGMVRDAEISISVVGKRKMATICKEYMNDGLQHDVLSFPLLESKGPFIESPDAVRQLGDIVVSFPMAVDQAAEQNILVDDSLIYLIEHGIMHLLGHHHDDGIDEVQQFVFPH